MNQWPVEVDALIAAPQHHKLVFENETVRGQCGNQTNNNHLTES